MTTENQDFKEGAINFSDIASDFVFDIPAEEAEQEVEVATELDFTPPATEEQNEEAIPSTTTETKKEEVVEINTELEETPFYKLTKKLIDSGKWSDANIEDEEGNSVKLSEYKNLTEDDYIELAEKQKTFELEELESKYIKAEGVDEDKKRIANIVLNGGDLKEIFQSPQAMTKPFSEELGWDLDNEEHQASIVYQHFLSQGMTEKQATSLVKAAQEEVNLDAQAKQIVDFHQKNYAEKLKTIESDLLAEKEAEKERVKGYRTELSKLYKQQDLPEPLTKRLVDLATKENTTGELLIDELYNKVMQDPKEAQEVILFLADKEAYLKSKMFETKKKANVETFRTISLIPRDKTKKAPQEEESTGDLIFEVPATKI